ncbi:MAG: putative oxygen-independent coproporphyrinogen III oxidase [Polaribacter sp.]
MNITYLPPLTLYIHYPWCVQKCPYCDFNSHGLNHKANQSLSEDDYIDALLKDLEDELPKVWGRSISAIFIGGGTPSLMSVKSMDRLLSGVRARLPFLSEIEITMEANPGTVEANKFAGFFEAGVNRISIGIQSFENEFLNTLGRIHNGNDAHQAFQIARDAGFKNINVDLMYALPNQSIKQAMQDLQTAIDLKPEHISWYQLTLEPNTAFHHSPPKNMADDDHTADISEKGLALLQEHQYQRYEVSAFSKEGNFSCWHNTNYWQFGDYLGIGAGAHGKITRADTQKITRTSKKRSPKDYLNIEKPFIDQENELSAQQMPFEFMLNALRLVDGVEAKSFFERTGITNNIIENVLDNLRKKELVTNNKDTIQTTTLGFQYLNEVLSEFADENFSTLNKKNKFKKNKIEDQIKVNNIS